jgi:hypothetical protein
LVKPGRNHGILKIDVLTTLISPTSDTHTFCFCFSSSNLEELTKGIQMIAALMDDEDDGNKLQDAAKNLADAFSNLLKAAHGSPGSPDNVSTEE